MERTRSLSIKSVKRYKYFLIGSISILFLSYVGYYSLNMGVLGIILALFFIGMMIFYWYPSIGKFIRKIHEVSYDNKNLYVKEGEVEVQIPFHQIRDVEIVSMDGLYKFNLYQDDQFGKEIICKPSIWYPLNFKRIDKELNRVRSLVRKAQREYVPEEYVSNRLHS